MRSARAWGVVLMTLVTTGHARAANRNPQARLVYVRGAGADGCADEAALRRAVAARVGYDPFFPWAKKAIIVNVSTRGTSLVARVELVDDEGRSEGSREVMGNGLDCGPLFDTLALTVSIAIDPHVLAPPAKAPDPEPDPVASEPPAPAPQPSGEKPALPPPAEQHAAPPREVPRERPAFALAANLRGSFGTEPAFAPGIALGALIAWRAASLGLEISADLPRDADVRAGGFVRAWLTAASFVPCLRFGVARTCALATVGRFEGSGEGVPSPDTRTLAYTALGVRAGLDVPLYEALSVTLHADLAYNFRPADLRVGADDVWTAARIPGALALGVVNTF